MNKAAENSSDPAANEAGTTAPSNGIQRSPWQPPAEVDPVPPPVEGSEPANVADRPG